MFRKDLFLNNYVYLMCIYTYTYIIIVTNSELERRNSDAIKV